MSDPWQVLHLRPDAPSEVIEAAYRALAKRLHPDAGGSVVAMAAVNSAYDAVRGNARGWKPPEQGEAIEGLRAEVARLRQENAALRAQPRRPVAADVRMGWGKHEGLPLSEVPADYLRWLTRQDWLDPDLADDIEDVLTWRKT